VTDLAFAGQPPQPFETVAASVRDELPDARATTLLAGMNEIACGAGSLGQVHAARLDDRPVAVKVLYRGVTAAVERDLSLMGMLRPIAQRSFPAADIDAVFAGVRETLLRECDYRHEREALERAHRLMARYPADVAIPAAWPAFCSRGVLTMDWLSGTSFREFAAVADQARRDLVGERLVRFFFAALFEERLLYGDPQPGNVSVGEDDRLLVVDFGSAALLEPEDLARFAAIFALAWTTPPAEEILRAFQSYGVVGDATRFDAVREAESLRHWVLKPFATQGRFRFDASFVAEAASRSFWRSPNHRHGTFNPRYVLLSRIYFGLYSMLVLLEAEADWHAIVRPLIEPFVGRPDPQARSA
jgi:predicted unusual protein kinase regulating ubiquinone biosynthesis (AarF/ABC1/UbiB family)